MTTKQQNPGQIMLSLLLACAVALALGNGCGSSTDPGGGDTPPLINFEPVAQGQEISLADTGEFSVVAPEAETIAVNWWRDGVIMSNALTYTYIPSSLGRDTLRVQVAADDVNRSYFWVINIVSTGTTLPPVVPSVTAGPGPAPGDVAVTWSRVTSSTRPLVEYAVAASYDGPITMANWDQALPLGRVTHRVGQLGFEAIYTAADDGMIPGAEIWVAVRAVDDVGQMSPVAENGFTTITTGWWLNGIILDDLDQPVVGTPVSSLEPAIDTNSDVDGLFQLGPFRNIDLVELVTISSNATISGWFDFHSPALDSVAGRDYEIRLITRHELDANCDLYGRQFLNYLRSMTRTQEDVTNPNAAKLWKWASYPLSVSVPDTVNQAGIDLGAAARAALEQWNSVMGETYFVEVADPGSANLVFRYDESLVGAFGQNSLLEPSGPGIQLGEVIPQKVEVYLWSAISNQDFARDIALHELGHALGMIEHTACSFSDYLMVAGGGSGSVHLDEQRLVRCIRRLPQGVDMTRYSLNR